jgi:hypothetical protein
MEWDGPSLNVDTGVLRARITPQAPLAEVRILAGQDWKPLWPDGDALRLTMHDSHGQLFESGHLPATVTVEEQGPLRSCICVRGHLATARGQSFCPYILRLHFAARRPEVRLQHTFVFDQDPDLVQLADIGIHVPAPPSKGSSPRAAVGGEHEAHESSGDLCFVQQDDLDYEVTDGADVVSGKRTRGWASLSSADGGVLAVIRDARQEYPKGFALGADGLEVQIWPRTATPLGIHHPFQGNGDPLWRDVG